MAGGVSRELIERSSYSTEGFPALYDDHRLPSPPTLVAVLARYAGVRPHPVADLGCGTGPSTRPWYGDADEAVGVEPNPAARLPELDDAATRVPGGRVVPWLVPYRLRVGVR